MFKNRSTNNIQLPDLHGRLAIVTGANSGVGFGITKRMAAAGAEVILAVRNFDKGSIAVKNILKENTKALLSVQLLDLASLKSVEAFAERMISYGKPIDYLFNNAGLMTSDQRYTTTDGFELHFGANYLGHFALTARLMPLLAFAVGSRVVMMASTTVHLGKINFDDLQYVGKYTSNRAYAQSKLAMLMFAIELHRQSVEHGWGIISNAAHPGATRTNIQLRNSSNAEGKATQPFSTKLLINIPGIWQDVEEGCLPALFAATDPEAVGGGYYGPQGIFELRGSPGIARIPRRAGNAPDRLRLWKISTQLTGVQFPHL